MSELKVSVSGVRGIWGSSLKFDTLLNYIKSFAIYLKKRDSKKILVARDGRITGDIIVNLITAIFNSYGIDVYYGGILPTPTLLLGVRELGFDGGIIVTASHNPEEWNALKFVKNDGTFTLQSDIDEIISYLDLPLEQVQYNKVGKFVITDKVLDLHLDKIIKNIDLESIRKRNFKVILDPVNSAGCKITTKLLELLNCDVKIINGEVNGFFSRKPEPKPENLKSTGEQVKFYKADIGFAQDPDADRLVIIDENGEVLSEELTLAFAVKHILSKKRGNVVVNLSTSMMCDEIASEFGCLCYRTKVGEANVVEGIKKYNALIGGEGNGGVIYPEINMARDSLTGIALILEMLANTSKKISEITKEMPYFIMKKETLSKNWGLLYNKYEDFFDKNFIYLNKEDGLWGRLKNCKGWIHLRPSNTEPIIRVIGEADNYEILSSYFEEIKKI
ncbi:MAG: phosphoglucosamine mutase [Brevinematales bacterium]|nr:phosphoglucosamine mutase [Brevinematales bacterium]